MTIPELTEEQYKLLHTPKRDGRPSVTSPLTSFGAVKDNIPECVFPRKQQVQKTINEV